MKVIFDSGIDNNQRDSSKCVIQRRIYSVNGQLFSIFLQARPSDYTISRFSESGEWQKLEWPTQTGHERNFYVSFYKTQFDGVTLKPNWDEKLSELESQVEVYANLLPSLMKKEIVKA